VWRRMDDDGTQLVSHVHESYVALVGSSVSVMGVAAAASLEWPSLRQQQLQIQWIRLLHLVE